MTAPAVPSTLTSRRSLLFGGLLGAAGLTALFGKGAVDLQASAPARLPALVPTRIGLWSAVSAEGLVLPTEAWSTDLHDQELHRIYISDGAPPMMVVLAYCARPQQGLLQIHDPQVCYPGSGFKVQQSRALKLPLGRRAAIEAQSFTAVRGPRVEQVVYWTRIGDRIAAPDDDQHVAILRTMLAGRVPDGLLVRISAIGNGPVPIREIRRFSAQLVGALPQAGRELLLGPSLAANWRGTA